MLTSGAAARLAEIAAETVDLLTGPGASRLRRCAAPDGGILVVEQHSRRRSCHAGRDHRDLQACDDRRRCAAGSER